MSTSDRPDRTGQYSRRTPGTERLLAGPERTHPPTSTRPTGVPRITLVIAAVLLIAILMLVVDNTAAMVLSVAAVATTLLALTVGVSRVPVLRHLTRSHRN